MKLFIFSAIVFFLSIPVYSEEQPPYKIKDPFINENFVQSYYLIDQHNHNDADSSPITVIPSTVTNTSGSFYCKTSSTGIILKSEDGNCHAFRVSNSSQLYIVSVPCPN